MMSRGIPYKQSGTSGRENGTVPKRTRFIIAETDRGVVHCPTVGNKLAVRSTGAGRSSEVERSLIVRWVVGSILHGIFHELFLVPASAPRLV